MSAKKIKKIKKVEAKQPVEANGPEGIIDEQISRIMSQLTTNRVRIEDLHHKLGWASLSIETNPPDADIEPTIPATLDFILSRLADEHDTIEAIHEGIGSNLGRIKLY